jgi:phosphoserine phosphatase RsbU/P
MPASSLSRLLKKKSPLASILGSLASQAGPLCILDADGTLLWGIPPQREDNRFPVRLGEQTIGWVSGGVNPGALVDLLAYAAAQEDEKKSLLNELLDRYRELNLLYHLSEALGTSPYPEAIARAALAEAIRIIPAESGQILVKGESSAGLQKIAEWGAPFQLLPGSSLVERVLISRKAELVEAAPAAEFLLEAGEQLVSIVCAPLKTEKNILGVILLAGSSERAFSAGELKLLNTIALQVAPVIELSRLHQVELEKARFERELQMARQVQESLLPQQMPEIPGWQFDRRWHPAHDVSGDFYDVIEEENGHLGMVVGDITGHGMPASLFMVFVRSALRASLARSVSPADALANANRVICHDSYRGLYATLFYTSLDTHTGELTYVNAGHPPALLYRRLPDTLELLSHPCLPLGIDTDTLYTHYATHLEKGDFVFFYTDGMIEAENPAHAEFGMERLKSEVYQRRFTSTAELLDGLEQTLATFTSPLSVEDDLTLMVVKRGD